MKTLRSRLIISHILPLIIVIPIAAVVLIYILETQVLLASLSDELAQQAGLTAEIAAGQPELWQDAAQAKIFITRFNTRSQSDLELLDPNGILIASTNPADTDQIGQPLDVPNLSVALSEGRSVQINYSLILQAEIVEVLVPVPGPDQKIVGVVRLTRELSSIYDQFLKLRYLTVGVLIAALLLAVALGLVLAFSLERSLRGVTQAIYGITIGRQWETLPEQGPEEVQLLVRAFNNLSERLRLLEDARKRLLANIVHEVGRPIGALQSAIQALLNGADEDVPLRRELLEAMQAEVNRMHPLLDNLTRLYDKVLGTLELDCRSVALSKWLSTTISPWREAVQAKDLRWQADIPVTMPTIEIDSDRLAQALGNLLSNSVKYTPAGENVAVSAGTENQQVWIKVEDTGPGIDQDELKQIFEPFFRSQGGRRFPQGIGLGLTIAQDLIVAHGGRLVVESEPGQGSCFTIWLPQEIPTPDSAAD